jgi:predicted dinucleotide-binding enzyme
MVPTHVLIVGAGNVGAALGTNLLGRGHQVTYAVRDVTRSVPEGAATVAIEGAGEGADLVILAVPFDQAAGVVARLELRPGTTLVDATNPFGRPLPPGAVSGASVVAAAVPDGIAVVKAFNVLGAEHMAAPALPDGSAPVLPVAGDDADARQRVAELAQGLGFDAVEVGGLDAAHTLEEAARYWGLLAFAGGLGRQVVLVAHQRPAEP